MKSKTKSGLKYPYVKKLVIPNLLWEHIQSLDVKEQEHYAFIPSFIKIIVDSDNQFQRVNIGRKVWLNAIGGNYRTYINNLIDWGIISIQLNENETESFKQGGHCKCYYLTTKAIESGFKVVNYSKRTPNTRTPQENIKLNSIDTTDPIINYSFQSIQNTISINPNTINTLICVDEAIQTIKNEYWLEKLTFNNYSIHYGKNCGRLYHPIICMSKVARQTVWFKDSDSVADYDIKSCYPVLMMKLVDNTEKTFYRISLDDDIYNTIIKDTKFSRTECKVAFQQFINGFVKNFVYYWFRKHLPKTLLVIEKDYKTMAKTLQQVESDIMIKSLIPYLITKNIKNVITCHDGWLSPNNSNDFVIIEFVKKAIYDYCGYVPTISKAIRTKQPTLICVDEGLKDDTGTDFKDILKESNRLSIHYKSLVLSQDRTKKKVEQARRDMFRGGCGYDRTKHLKYKTLKTELNTITEKLNRYENN